MSSSMPSSRTSTSSPGCGRRLVLPLVQGHEALGLVADVDDDLVADDLDDLARDDRADLEALALAQELFEVVGAVLGGRRPPSVRSSLTSNSRSRLRSTMFGFRFDSSPAHRGRTCWSDRRRAGGAEGKSQRSPRCSSGARPKALLYPVPTNR